MGQHRLRYHLTAERAPRQKGYVILWPQGPGEGVEKYKVLSQSGGKYLYKEVLTETLGKAMAEGPLNEGT